MVDWGLHPSDLFAPSFGEGFLEAWQESKEHNTYSISIGLLNLKDSNTVNIVIRKLDLLEKLFGFHVKSWKKKTTTKPQLHFHKNSVLQNCCNYSCLKRESYG